MSRVEDAVKAVLCSELILDQKVRVQKVRERC